MRCRRQCKQIGVAIWQMHLKMLAYASAQGGLLELRLRAREPDSFERAREEHHRAIANYLRRLTGMFSFRRQSILCCKDAMAFAGASNAASTSTKEFSACCVQAFVSVLRRVTSPTGACNHSPDAISVVESVACSDASEQYGMSTSEVCVRGVEVPLSQAPLDAAPRTVGLRCQDRSIHEL